MASSSARFIGRRGERAALERLIAESRSGSARVVLVSGEAGIGKSRLIGEVLDDVRGAGHRVLLGRCVNLAGDDAPLAPFSEALRAWAAETPRAELDEILGASRAAVSTLMPGLPGPNRPEAATGLMHASVQDRVHVHLVEVLSRLARRSPLVLVIEDIHWADRSTLLLLSLLVRNMTSLPMALLLSHRTDEPVEDARVAEFIVELDRLARPERIVLTRFSRSEVLDQVAAIRGAEARGDLVEHVYTQSEGNPFYVEELLSAMSDSETVPGSLGALLEARLAALSEPAGRVAGAAAVRGTASSDGELAAVSALSASDFRGAVRELLARKIFERRTEGGREMLAFRHALLEAAAYGDLLPGERRDLHLAYAAMLEPAAEAGDAAALAELARHREAAGDMERALTAALRAAAAAETTYQPLVAHDQYERAVRIMERQPELAAAAGLDRVGVLERAAAAAASAGSAQAPRHIVKALALVDAEADPVVAGLLHERLGRYLWYEADGAGSLEAYREAVRLVPAEPMSVERARVTAGLAQLLMILARFDDSMRYCREALANARAVGDLEVEGHVTDTLGVNTAYLGDADEGLRLLWSAHAIAEQVGNLEDVGRAYANLLDVLRVAARYQQAADLGRESFEYLREHGLATTYGVGVLNYAGWSLYSLGRWSESLDLLERARRYPMRLNDEVMNLCVTGSIEAGCGRFEQARAHLDTINPLISAAIDTQLLLPYAEAQAQLGLWTGQPRAALDAVLDGIDRSEPLVGGNISRYGPVYALGIRAAADLVLAAEDAARARESAARLLADVERAHDEISIHQPAHVQLAAPFRDLCRAEMSRLEQRDDVDLWRTAGDQLATLGLGHFLAYARWRQGEADLQREGRAGGAQQPLREAATRAADLGAMPLAQAIERLARRARVELGVSPAKAADATDIGLTAREVEVLRLVAAGKTNREIGDELFITDKTASVHVSHVLSKLGVSRRAEAAAIATRLGLGNAATSRID